MCSHFALPNTDFFPIGHQKYDILEEKNKQSSWTPHILQKSEACASSSRHRLTCFKNITLMLKIWDHSLQMAVITGNLSLWGQKKRCSCIYFALKLAGTTFFFKVKLRRGVSKFLLNVFIHIILTLWDNVIAKLQTLPWSVSKWIHLTEGIYCWPRLSWVQQQSHCLDHNC